MIALLRRVWRLSPVRYLVVGAAAFGIDFGLLYALHEGAGIDLSVSTATAFLLSFAITFLLQRWITFGASARLAGSAVRYTILVGVNTVATTLIVATAASLHMSWEVGKVIAVASTTVWNFFAYRYWVYRPRTRSTTDPTSE